MLHLTLFPAACFQLPGNYVIINWRVEVSFIWLNNSKLFRQAEI